MNPEEITTPIVVFVMRALIEGRLTRPAACRLVAPWVEDIGIADPVAEAGAQLIHGLDVVVINGREHHASKRADESGYAVSDADAVKRCRTWIAAHGGEADPDLP